MFFYITCKKKRKKNQASTFDMLHTEHKAEPVVTQCWACGVCWNCSCYTHGKYCPAVLHEGNGACICKVCLLVNCHYSDMWHIVHWQSTLCLWCMLCLWHILDQRMVCAVLGVYLCLQCIQCAHGVCCTRGASVLAVYTVQLSCGACCTCIWYCCGACCTCDVFCVCGVCVCAILVVYNALNCGVCCTSGVSVLVACQFCFVNIVLWSGVY